MLASSIEVDAAVGGSGDQRTNLEPLVKEDQSRSDTKALLHTDNIYERTCSNFQGYTI